MTQNHLFMAVIHLHVHLYYKHYTSRGKHIYLRDCTTFPAEVPEALALLLSSASKAVIFLVWDLSCSDCWSLSSWSFLLSLSILVLVFSASTTTCWAFSSSDFSCKTYSIHETHIYSICNYRYYILKINSVIHSIMVRRKQSSTQGNLMTFQSFYLSIHSQKAKSAWEL